jgi:CRISPR/Cas system CSM-associated protein Csm2 small subunit
MDTGYLSPWSDESHDSSDDDAGVDSPRGQQMNSFAADRTRHQNISINKASNGTLLESMRGVESVLGQLVRLGFKIRQCAAAEGPRKVDATSESREQTILRQDLIAMLCVPTGRSKPSAGALAFLQNDQIEDGLSQVQIRLINSALRRRNNSRSAWNHNINSQLPAQANDASMDTIWSDRSGEEDRSEIFSPDKRSSQQTRTEQREQAISKVLTEWISTHPSNPYPTAAEKTALQNATGLNAQQLNAWFKKNRHGKQNSGSKDKQRDWTPTKLANDSRKKAPNTMFQVTASSVGGRSSAQAELEPTIAQKFAESRSLPYPHARKVEINGESVLQCPCCAQVFHKSFVEDSHRWRLVLSSLNHLSRLIIVAENTSIKTSCHMYAQSKTATFLTSVMVQLRTGNHI